MHRHNFSVFNNVKQNSHHNNTQRWANGSSWTKKTRNTDHHVYSMRVDDFRLLNTVTLALRDIQQFSRRFHYVSGIKNLEQGRGWRMFHYYTEHKYKDVSKTFCYPLEASTLEQYQSNTQQTNTISQFHCIKIIIFRINVVYRSLPYGTC